MTIYNKHECNMDYISKTYTYILITDTEVFTFENKEELDTYLLSQIIDEEIIEDIEN